jgi:ArsR family transcriptional regulator, nickel/cobalt-responsive transcriptional repressor
MAKRSKDSALSTANDTALMLKAVADPDRLKIIESLRHGSKTVSDLAKILRAEIVNVSHHLGVLRRRKLVGFQKKGRFVHYTLNPAVYKVSDRGETLLLGGCKLEIGK